MVHLCLHYVQAESVREKRWKMFFTESLCLCGEILIGVLVVYQLHGRVPLLGAVGRRNLLRGLY